MADEGGFERLKETVLGIVSQHFRPEFVNRIDDLVVFHALNREQVARIAELQFGILRARLEEQDIGIRLTDSALEALVDEGYDPVYGARPLKRAIQKRIENPLAAKLLAGDVAPGGEVRVQRRDGAFEFDPAPGAPPSASTG